MLPAEARARFHQMIAFRNRAVHLYEELDPEHVFVALENDPGDFDLFVDALTDRYLAHRDS